MIPDLDTRLAHNLDVVMAEISAPRRGRLEQALLRVHVPESTARLVSATPALRVAWFVSVAMVLAFAASAGDASWTDASRFAVLLTLAPLAPVVGVALSYGPHADRTHEIAVAAPLSGLRLALIRSITVLTASAALTTIGVLLAPSAGWLRVAWLLPSMATASATLALGSRFGIRPAAFGVAAVWLTLVVLVAQIADDGAAPFGAGGQLAAFAVTCASAAALAMGRRRLERWDGR